MTGLAAGNSLIILPRQCFYQEGKYKISALKRLLK